MKKNRCKKIFRDKRGVTLIELVVAIGVLGVFLLGVSLFFANNLTTYTNSVIKMQMSRVAEGISNAIVDEIKLKSNIILRDESEVGGNADDYGDNTNSQMNYLMLGKPEKYLSMKMKKGYIYKAVGRSSSEAATLLISEAEYDKFSVSYLRFYLLDTKQLNVMKFEFSLTDKSGKKSYKKETTITMTNFLEKLEPYDSDGDGSNELDTDGKEKLQNTALSVAVGACPACKVTDHKLGATQMAKLDQDGNIVLEGGNPVYYTDFPKHRYEGGKHYLSYPCPDANKLVIIDNFNIEKKYNCIGYI